MFDNYYTVVYNNANLIIKKQMANKTRKIVLPQNNHSTLAVRCGYSYETIRRALSYQTKSKVADKIREIALKEFGGKKVSF